MSRFRLQTDIVKDTRQQYSFSEYMDALNRVFANLWFDDYGLCRVLLDSYRMNLWHIALHAIENGIDEIEHIQSIQSMLLTMPGCRLRTQNQR